MWAAPVKNTFKNISEQYWLKPNVWICILLFCDYFTTNKLTDWTTDKGVINTLTYTDPQTDRHSEVVVSHEVLILPIVITVVCRLLFQSEFANNYYYVNTLI